MGRIGALRAFRDTWALYVAWGREGGGGGRGVMRGGDCSWVDWQYKAGVEGDGDGSAIGTLGGPLRSTHAEVGPPPPPAGMACEGRQGRSSASEQRDVPLLTYQQHFPPAAGVSRSSLSGKREVGGGANAETTPAGAPAAAADRTQ